MTPTYKSWIAGLGFRPDTATWSAVSSAIVGDPLDDDAAALYRARSGGLEPPGPEGLSRVEVIAGRRAGKSEAASRTAIYSILHGGHEAHLAPGQLGVYVIIAPRLEQADECFNYAVGLVSHRSIKNKVEGIRNREIEFRSGLILQVTTADAFSVRGKSLIGAIIEEACFLDSTGKGVTSQEVFDALLPGLQRTRNMPVRRCIVISSAYTTRGAAYEIYRDCYGVADAPWTVFHGSSQEWNSDLDETDIEAARKRSDKAYRREYLSEFQDQIDGSSWFGLDVIEQCVEKDRLTRPYELGLEYVAAVDFAFRHDSTAVAIATHRKTATGSLVDIVHVQEIKSPKGGASPSDVCRQVRFILSQYGLRRCFIDQHESSSLTDLLDDVAVRADVRNWKGSGPESKSIKYNAVLDAMRDKRVRLPDHPELLQQLRAVTGELLPSGVERIQARKGHDDLASAVVLAVDEAFKTSPNKADSELTWWDREEASRIELNTKLAMLAVACPQMSAEVFWKYNRRL